MSEEIKIITLGDIFKNIETEEKAFKFKDYIKDLQQKVEQLENIRKEALEYINHATIGAYSSPIEDSWLYNLYETKHILNKGE